MIHGTHISKVQLRELGVLKLPIYAKEPLGVPDKKLDFNNSYKLLKLFLAQRGLFGFMGYIGSGQGALGLDLLPFKCVGFP